VFLSVAEKNFPPKFPPTFFAPKIFPPKMFPPKIFPPKLMTRFLMTSKEKEAGRNPFDYTNRHSSDALDRGASGQVKILPIYNFVKKIYKKLHIENGQNFL
jgi:hypothetical protein